MDRGAILFDVQVDGCPIDKVPVDSGSAVNVMLQETAWKLGHYTFAPTKFGLRMANQSYVHTDGVLFNLPTLIGGQMLPVNYIIFHVEGHCPYQILLGRPWLYQADAHVFWRDQTITFGQPRVELSFAKEKYEGESASEEEEAEDVINPTEKSSVPVQRVDLDMWEEISEDVSTSPHDPMTSMIE